jgi:hypothetical protein
VIPPFNILIGVVALALTTAVFVGLGILIAGLLSIMLSITDLSRWGDRMRWTIPISGGTQVLAALSVYVVGMRSTESVILPLLAAPILSSGLFLLFSRYQPKEKGVSRKCPCPNCDATEYTQVPAYRGSMFTNVRTCTVCGTRYTPPTPLWEAVVSIVLGILFVLPGIVTIGVGIKEAITMQQGAFALLFIGGMCVCLPSPLGIACILHGWRYFLRGPIVRERRGAE